MRASSWAAALVLAGSGLALAQVPRPTATPPPLTFETGVEIINIAVSVTDSGGRYVTGLGNRDFSVFEDGIRQELTLFSHEDLPISMVVLLDCSASMDAKLPVARAAATRFVKTLRPMDQAQVVQFNDRPLTLQGFTSDQRALEAAIHRTVAAGPTALHNALYISLKELARQKKVGELRRRAVVLLSDGEDTASLVNDEQVIELARQTEIAIYAISLTDRRRQNRDTQQAFSQARHLLTVLTRDTGGQVYFPSSLSELDSTYDRIAEELRTQYNLGYVSSNRRRDGRWRRIVVRVPLREDVQIRHKIGYYAPRERG